MNSRGLSLALIVLTGIVPSAKLWGEQRTPPAIGCSKKVAFRVSEVVGWSTPAGGSAFFYTSGLAVDADGAYRAYHPGNNGLDSLTHAGYPGNWWALATDDDTKTGNPVVQGPSDPAPGYYVSTTALYDRKNRNPRDPRRYVDAATVPYIVLPPRGLRYARLGDFATVINLRNGKISGAIVADESQELPDRIGEGSMALAKALGIDPDPREGGQDDGRVVYLVYPGSGNGAPRSVAEIARNSQSLFERWGGMAKIRGCVVDSSPHRK